ncbi:peptidoglycan-binding protein [Oerskovia sp. Sa1BUA8]|uniref:Peptidoglycan-binding protein n=1 Tax=Oerskovia douganii TaxID=2762210 RepID=A0A9D5YZZ3_9CELL|nr:peptidoglycan-binding protein [Oerskovia douganii]MBE7702278.1 peptidoglycan-binding protein [Oerskovia douganii]
MNRMRARREGSGGVLYVSCVFVLILTAALCSWWLSRSSADALDDLDPTGVAVEAPVRSASVDYSSPAILSGTFVVAPAVLSTGLQGVITALPAVEGSVLQTGQVVYSIDGVPVVAYASETVFYRNLSVGAKGEDVEAAQELLRTLLPESGITPNGIYSESTARTVRSYERKIGRTPTGNFDPQLFVRLPHDQYVVAKTDLAVGAAAPGFSMPVMESQAELHEVTVSGATRGPDGAYEFVSQGVAIPLERSGDTWIVDAAASEPFLRAAAEEDGSAKVDGRSRLAAPLSGLVVPGGAVYSGTDGAQCLFIADGASDYKSEKIELIGSDVSGAAQVAGDLDTDDSVLVNPYVVMGKQSCH